MRYLVMIRRTATGYSVDVPDLPGCVATATTVEHARQMIQQAIEMHLELMQKSGQAIPPPTDRMEFSVDDASGEEFCTWVEVETAQPVSA
ncbi:MAG: type II toxin-antitoxin system HicB family antitoxin [Planctomycetes bacterium]|nr:type II toxin-antitoxin system HicB family antitoxin [Planctomycetota bacterium]